MKESSVEPEKPSFVMFEPGLKFIDQNGNKFVTLGGYLLYKVD